MNTVIVDCPNCGFDTPSDPDFSEQKCEVCGEMFYDETPYIDEIPIKSRRWAVGEDRQFGVLPVQAQRKRAFSEHDLAETGECRNTETKQEAAQLPEPLPHIGVNAAFAPKVQQAREVRHSRAKE